MCMVGTYIQEGYVLMPLKQYGLHDWELGNKMGGGNISLNSKYPRLNMMNQATYDGSEHLSAARFYEISSAILNDVTWSISS